MKAEFQGSHYHLIRTNPLYRMMCRQEELDAERQPSWCQDLPEHEVIPPPPSYEGDYLFKRIENQQARIMRLEKRLDDMRKKRESVL